MVALDEVSQLGAASHPTLGPRAPLSLSLARAVGRGQIVLLSSHFERYIYAVNEELVGYLNQAQIAGDRLPLSIRLQHSMLPIDELAKRGWERRKDKLTGFVTQEAWLWSAGLPGSLMPDRLLTWMKAPAPANLVRYFRSWGLADVFTLVTRRPHTRAALWLGVQGLVELRNNIAHGDFSAQATQADVRRYMGHIRMFCERVDRLLAAHVARTLSIQRPW